MSAQVRDFCVVSHSGEPVMQTTMTQLQTNLTRVLGHDGARTFLTAMLSELGLREVRTADDLFRIGDMLCSLSSDVAAAGHSAKVHAILNGAKPR